MGGFELVQRSFKSVFDNLNVALAISGLPWIALLALQIIIGGSGSTDVGSDTVPQTFAMSVLFLSLLAAFVSLWVAVAWHRFILLGEAPTSLMPPFHGGRIGAYLKVSIIVGLVIGIGFLLLALVLSPLFALLTFTGGVQLISFGLLMLVSYAFYRVCPVFPAAAIGQEEGLGSAWKRTKPIATEIWAVAVIFALIGTVIQLPVIALGAGLLGMLYSLVSGWIMLMVGVSLLTTIYQETEGTRL